MYGVKDAGGHVLEEYRKLEEQATDLEKRQWDDRGGGRVKERRTTKIRLLKNRLSVEIMIPPLKNS